MSFLEPILFCNILSVFEIKRDIKRVKEQKEEYNALSYRISGDAQFISNGREFEVKKDDIVFVPSFHEYERITYKNEHLVVIHFNANSAESEFQSRGIESFTPEDSSILKNLFLSAFDVWNNKNSGYQYAATSYFYNILSRLQKQYMGTHILGSSEKMKYALEYIHENYTKPELNIAYLAELIGVSETYFRRLFFSALKTTPLQYINNLRINHAEELLKSGYYAVYEVAKMSGFSDPKYFSKVIKKHRGVPPAELKKKK